MCSVSTYVPEHLITIQVISTAAADTSLTDGVAVGSAGQSHHALMAQHAGARHSCRLGCQADLSVLKCTADSDSADFVARLHDTSKCDVHHWTQGVIKVGVRVKEVCVLFISACRRELHKHLLSSCGYSMHTHSRKARCAAHDTGPWLSGDIWRQAQAHWVC